MLPQLRQHQKQAYESSKTPQRCLINMFCGTGKTNVIVQHLRDQQSGEFCIVVFPSLALIEQFKYDYVDKYLILTHVILNICSSTDHVTGETSIEKLTQFFNVKHCKPVTVITTYDSLGIALESIQITQRQIKYIFFDEAHRVTRANIRDLLWSANMESQPIFSLIEHCVFLTASPHNKNNVIMDPMLSKTIDRTSFDFLGENGLLPEGAQCEIVDANIKGHCGSIVTRYSYANATKDSICNDFIICTDFGVIREDVTPEQIILESALRTMIQNQKSRCLSFHTSVKNGVVCYTYDKLIAAFEYVLIEFPKETRDLYTHPEIIHVTATDCIWNYQNSADEYKRNLALQDFDTILDFNPHSTNNRLCVLASCRTIGEGIDTKKSQVVIFADPKTSKIEIMQNVGRVCRAYEGMQPAIVLIPVIVDKKKYEVVQHDSEKRDQLIRKDLSEKNDFSAILNVCSALRQSDPLLYNLHLFYPNNFAPSEIKSNLRAQGCKSNIEDKSLYSVANSDLQDILEECIDETHNYIVQQYALKRGKRIQVHSTSMETPIEFFGSGDDDVFLLFYDADKTQYELFEVKNTTLTPPTRKRSNKLQVRMHPDVMILWKCVTPLDFISKITQNAIIDSEVYVVQWNVQLKRLCEFYEQHQRLPKQNTKNKAEDILATWISTQRERYHEGKMIETRKINLEALSWWKWEDIDQWPENLAMLIDFQGKYKRMPKQTALDRNEKLLAGWISNQRQNYLHNKITDERKLALEQNAWWEWSIEDVWPQNFENLTKYCEVYKCLPTDIKENKTLVNWIGHQRQAYRKKEMSEDRIQKLNSLPWWTWGGPERLQKSWNENFQQLITFWNHSKRFPKQNTKNEKSLAHWIGDQRKAYHNNKIDPDRQHQLETLDWWKWKIDEWDDKFANLIIFYNENQHLPRGRPTNETEKKLSQWISDQRRNELLTIERQKQLLDLPWLHYKLPGKVTKQQRASPKEFSERLQMLIKFWEKNKRFPTTRSKDAITKSLGTWLTEQVRKHTSGELSDEHRQQILALDFLKSKFQTKGTLSTQQVHIENKEENLSNDNHTKSQNTKPDLLENPIPNVSESKQTTKKRKSTSNIQVVSKRQLVKSQMQQIEKERAEQEEKRNQKVQQLEKIEALCNIDKKLRTKEQKLELKSLVKQFSSLNCDSYDELSMTIEHQQWKQVMNNVFVDACVPIFSIVKRPTILYFDGPKMLTTKTLRQKFGNRPILYVANNCQTTFHDLKNTGEIDNIVQGDMVTILLNQWKDVNFDAVYFDHCGGTAKSTIDLILALMNRMSQTKLYVLGITITPRDPTGDNMTCRIDKIEKEIFKQRKVIRMQDLMSTVDKWTDNGVVTRFYKFE